MNIILPLILLILSISSFADNFIDIDWNGKNCRTLVAQHQQNDSSNPIDHIQSIKKIAIEEADNQTLETIYKSECPTKITFYNKESLEQPGFFQIDFGLSQYTFTYKNNIYALKLYREDAPLLTQKITWGQQQCDVYTRSKSNIQDIQIALDKIQKHPLEKPGRRSRKDDSGKKLTEIYPNECPYMITTSMPIVFVNITLPKGTGHRFRIENDKVEHLGSRWFDQGARR